MKMFYKLLACLVVLGLTAAAPLTSTRGEVCSSHDGRLENCQTFEEMETKANKNGDPSGDNSGDDEDEDEDDHLESFSLGWTHSVGSLEAAEFLGLLGVMVLAVVLVSFIRNSLVSYCKRVRHQHQYQQLT